MTFGELKQIIENMDASIPSIVRDCNNNCRCKVHCIPDVSINASHRLTNFEPGGNATSLIVSRYYRSLPAYNKTGM